MLLLSLVTLALLLPLCAAFGGSQSYSHVTKRAAVNMLAVGDVAPDFEMVKLKLHAVLFLYLHHLMCFSLALL